MKSRHSIARTLMVLFPLLGAGNLAHGGENPALWEYQVKGDFAKVLADLKAGLEARQFQISSEKNLFEELQDNAAGPDQNERYTEGFENVTALHFCSKIFNHQMYNLNLVDQAVLCPFRTVVHNRKDEPDRINILMVRPAYLVASDPDAGARGAMERIEGEIISAITDAVR